MVALVRWVTLRARRRTRRELPHSLRVMLVMWAAPALLGRLRCPMLLALMIPLVTVRVLRLRFGRLMLTRSRQVRSELLCPLLTLLTVLSVLKRLAPRPWSGLVHRYPMAWGLPCRLRALPAMRDGVPAIRRLVRCQALLLMPAWLVRPPMMAWQAVPLLMRLLSPGGRRGLLVLHWRPSSMALVQT